MLYRRILRGLLVCNLLAFALPVIVWLERLLQKRYML